MSLDPWLPKFGNRRPQPRVGKEGDLVRRASAPRHRRHPRGAEGSRERWGGRPVFPTVYTEVAIQPYEQI